MAGNPFLQDLDPAGVPDPVTPADGPSDAAGWAKVTPSGAGPAPYDLNAPQDIDGITAAFNAANDLTGAGVLYPKGPRQQEAAAIMDSVQGFGAANVITGFPDYETADIMPPAQPGYMYPGEYPGTTQDVPGYGMGGGIDGVTPETGDMGGGAGLGYPGTTQDGVPQYGT